MAHLVVYGLSAVALAHALVRTWGFADRMRLPRVVTACVTAALLLYAATVLPAALGLLSGAVAGILLTVLACGTSWLLGNSDGGGGVADLRHPAAPLAAPCPGAFSRGVAGPWNPCTLGLCVAGAVAARPLVEWLLDLRGRLTHPGVPLTWDAVTYHLPTLAEMCRRQSLWGLQGPFASYPCGFELLAGYPSLFFGSHAGFVLAHAYALLFLIASVVLLCEVVVDAIDAGGSTPRVNFFATAAVAVGLWCLVYPAQCRMVGKNDAFTAALVISAFCLLVGSAGTGGNTPPGRSAALLVLAAAATGVAAGTKASALLFTPFFAGLALVTAPGAFDSARAAVRAFAGRGVARAAAFTGIAASTGAIWYVRNLIETGDFVAPEHQRYFQLSLVQNLANPRLYHVHRTSVVSALAAVTPLVALAFAAASSGGRPPPRRKSLPLFAFAAFLAAAAVAYAYTPLVFFEDRRWQLRLGMPFFSGAAVAAAVALAWAASWPVWRGQWAALACAALAIVLVVVPVRWSQKRPPALPPLADVPDGYSSGVYDWVAARCEPTRIYSAGLRPYGVLGRGWENEVFADANSHLLFDEDVRGRGAARPYDLAGSARAHAIVGKARLCAILRSFRPDLVIIAVDSDEQWPPERPLVAWMRGQPCFEQVYEDPFATAFRVREGWERLAAEYPAPPNRRLRMGP